MTDDDLYQDDFFSWRMAKARTNATKHKITFEQSKSVFETHSPTIWWTSEKTTAKRDGM